MVHKHGPCSQVKVDVPTHSDILSQDQKRVNYIHSKLSKNYNSAKESYSGQSGGATLPVKSGSLIGSGNYFVVVGLGTPKSDLSLVFDTGSDLTWTQCQPCARSCYKQQDPIFDPKRSTSYYNITCTSSDCTQLTSATGKIKVIISVHTHFNIHPIIIWFSGGSIYMLIEFHGNMYIQLTFS